ncbi:MAG TPA: HEAT repeat domain-containing protein, partial [Bryobacteraceae bacterium]|nr:HEAT repeat domain-containing protein [Bryobacteraceae bacterium]
MRIVPFLLLSVVAAAQVPRIGIIDFYGLRKVSEERIRKVLGVKEGDPLPASKGNTEEHLDRVPGVVESHLEAVCCDEGKMILYVGIEEKGAVHFDLHETPEGDVRLSPEIKEAFDHTFDAIQKAVLRGSVADDLTHGHSLMADPDAREAQQGLIPLARDHLRELREVLRNSSDEEHRSAAAYVIGYAPQKAEIVGDLQYALRDPDSSVRNHAMRSLLALAVLQQLDPRSGIKVQATWFIEMLNSLAWTDRNKSSAILQILTDKRDPLVLDQLRDRALPALVDMARWKAL